MELYEIFDLNEIDGSVKDVEIVTNGNHDDENTWTDILIDAQELPAGDYTFGFSFMFEVHPNEEYYWRLVPISGDGPNLPYTEVKTERQSGRYYFQYSFIYSWDGGPFNYRFQVKAKDAAGLGNSFVRYMDYSMQRRT
jgi:hypothetical protein